MVLPLPISFKLDVLCFGSTDTAFDENDDDDNDNGLADAPTERVTTATSAAADDEKLKFSTRDLPVSWLLPGKLAADAAFVPCPMVFMLAMAKRHTTDQRNAI